MAKYASKVVAQAKAWLGLKESDGSYQVILDTYNSQEKLPRGYRMTTKDPWCATFVSAVAVKLGYTDIIPTECSCTKMIELFKKIGSWVESDSYVPKPGDILFYDWDDSGKGENTGGPEHVGIVEKVSGSQIIVIEGNYSNSVKRRTIAVNGRYVRGYGVPKYDKESKFNPDVFAWQNAAIADGYKFPKYGADGKWGAECEAVAKQAVVKRRRVLGINYYTNKNLTRWVQKKLGFTGNDVDGKCGNKTHDAIGAYQEKHGLTKDYAAGLNTYKEMIGIA